ncbi:MAG: FAD-binding oxidoreductase [Pseudomonadota bacterium]
MNVTRPHRTAAPDVLVIGAGVFGLWCARACAQAGLTVVLAERTRAGAGASGGPVGALTPHQPANWSELKEFQAQSLLALPAEIAALEVETGLATGYAPVGRLTPVASEKARQAVTAQSAAAAAHWGGRQLEWRATAPQAGLLAEDALTHGLIHDTLSARIEPRAYLAALEASLDALGVVRRYGWRLLEIGDKNGGPVRFDAGQISAGAVVLAMGWEGFGVAGLTGSAGVKGQAAILAADLPKETPVIQGRGLYVCAHGTGRVGVGSTSETAWTHPDPDTRLDETVAAARALCPALAGAPVIERWAGVRPRAPARVPVVGRLPRCEPGHGNIWIANGGYKIGFGLAHAIGRNVAADIAGQATPQALPVAFAPEHHRTAIGKNKTRTDPSQ